MRSIRIFNLMRALIGFTLSGMGWGGTAASPDFNREIRPLLAEYCFECHGPDAARRKAGLRLDTRDGFEGTGGQRIVQPGNSLESELVRRITSVDPESRMPPQEARRRPTPDEIDRMVRWAEQGAVYEEHWAFVSPQSAIPPRGVDADWGRNGIDGFVQSLLESRGMRPQPEADRSTLIRRLSLDLRGLPPTPGEVVRFLGDGAPGAYSRLVDRFLDSPSYGENMAWSWMEAARYADTDGFQSDARRHMWRWREWVIEAFNQNMGYDRFTVEQLAGDLLPDAGVEQLLATGFNRNHRYDKGSGTVQAESVFENATDRLETTATVWLGLTMNCARCHDHKFDPISSKEYYAMLAFFDKVPENGQAILFNSHPRLATPDAEQRMRLAGLDLRRAEAAAELRELEPEIRRQQSAWERQLEQGFVERPLFPDGLAHHFALDEPGPKGTERDGRVAFGPGVRSNAMRFDGRAYLELDRSVGNLWGRDEFSLAFWFRLDDLSDGTILSELEDPEDLRLGTVVDVHDGRLRFMLSHRWNYAVTWFELEPPLETNRWYHFAVTCDGRVQMLAYRAYLDGEVMPFRVLQDSAVDGKKVNVPMLLGGSPLGPGFRGDLDELRFQRRVLLEREVAALSVRRSIAEIARISEASRSERESSAIRAYFLEHSVAGQPARVLARVRALERERKTFHDSLPTTMVMMDRPDAAVTRVRRSGRFDQRGEPVQPGTPAILPAFGTGLPRNRLGLARWLIDPRHPLTSRVTVNRIWQHFFGAGFVEAPENFGARSPEPIHADLLDWLASEFVRREWNVKGLIRLIVNSATYRQRSSAPESLWLRDPDNRLLGRGPRHRLGAAALRDQALEMGGLLVRDFGGPSVFPQQPDGLWKLTSNQPYESPAGSGRYRRSLYSYWRRSIAPPFMSLFDAPGRESCNVALRRTNTPLQALAGLNEPAMFEAAQALGRRMIREGGALTGDRIRFGFRIVTAREPTREELELLHLFLDRVKKEPEPFALLANLLLNTDLALTKE